MFVFTQVKSTFKKNHICFNLSCNRIKWSDCIVVKMHTLSVKKTFQSQYKLTWMSFFMLVWPRQEPLCFMYPTNSEVKYFSSKRVADASPSPHVPLRTIYQPSFGVLSAFLSSVNLGSSFLSPLSSCDSEVPK